jgi:hypothetical protein
VTQPGRSSNEQLLVAGGQPGVGPNGLDQGVWTGAPLARGHCGEPVEGLTPAGQAGLVAPKEPGHELADCLGVARPLP